MSDKLCRTVSEAAKALSVSRATIYRMADAGQIKLVRIGGRTVVPEVDLQRIAENGADLPGNRRRLSKNVCEPETGTRGNAGNTDVEI